jgi:hypothetical protein
MSRVRLIQMSLLAAFVVSAIASASASAACSTEGGDTGPLYCLNNEKDGQIGKTGLDEGGGEAEFHSTGNVYTLKIFGLAIECAKETGSGVILQQDSKVGRDSDIVITWTGCKIVNNPKCIVQDSVKKVAGTIEVANEIDSELKLEGGKIYDRLFSSEAGEKWVTVEIKKHGTETCLAEGRYEVTGEACGETNSEQKVKSPLKFSTAITEACNVIHPLKTKGVNAGFTGESIQELVGVAKVENELTHVVEEINVAGLPWGTTVS